MQEKECSLSHGSSYQNCESNVKLFQLVCTCAVPTHQTLFPWEGVAGGTWVGSGEVGEKELMDLYSQHSSDCSSHCHLLSVCKEKGLEDLHWVRIRGRHRAPSRCFLCPCVCKQSHCQATREYWVSYQYQWYLYSLKICFTKCKISWLCCEVHWASLYSSAFMHELSIKVDPCWCHV